jgi:amino acid transporter
MRKKNFSPSENGHQFGTFGGVFTPSILTILGLIMFMRAGYVVGLAGVRQAIGILLISTIITLMTSLSVSAISSNTRIRGGGAYFMVSRVLGPELGGAIGIALFFAQALSIPFYTLGFTEALTTIYPSLSPFFMPIGVFSASVLFLVSYVGAEWAIRAQYLILSILALSIAAFMGGLAQGFSTETLTVNWWPADTPAYSLGSVGVLYSFWSVFAIYFPAVTGIMAGVNMSGDLKDPVRSISRGTLLAVGVSFVIYLSQILLAGGAVPRQELLARPFEALRDRAWWGLGFLVNGGVFAATLSSALGSFIGAPRIIQAIGRDQILPFLDFFSKGTPRRDEPRRALFLTYVLTLAVLLWAGNGSGGGALNAVAAVITMFFLATYGITNLAAFIESFGANPSFRPRFKWFHWSAALLGALGCSGAALLINPGAALVAILLVSGLLWYLHARELKVAFGDSRRGFIYAAIRKNLLRLNRFSEGAKNWRPTILVFSGNPQAREFLVRFANWLASGRGIVYFANILLGSLDHYARHRAMAVRSLDHFCREKEIPAFPIVVVSETLDQGVAAVLQAASVGPIRPNLAMFGWSSEVSRISLFLRQLSLAEEVGMSLVILKSQEPVLTDGMKRIDVWWQNPKTSRMMLILAYLLTHNREWKGAVIRVLRVIPDEAGRAAAEQVMQELIEKARMKASGQVIVSQQSFNDVFRETSAQSACIFFGFSFPEKGREDSWCIHHENLLADMPPTLLVSSENSGELLE